jgi:signal transduction histidine kinase
MRASADQRQLTFAIQPIAGQVLADSDAIMQILTNPLSNGIKFAPTQSCIVLSAASAPSPVADDPSPWMIRFGVTDQGRGIPSDMVECIFEQFRQVDASDSRQEGGTGLGLAICRKIVQQHGGEIWVESTLGQGSTFYFTLPVVLD